MMFRGIFVAVVAAIFVTFLAGAASADAGAGEKVFQAKCKACHAITDKKVLGPGLAGTMKMHSEEWMKAWLADPQKTWEDGSAETKELIDRVKGKKKTKMKIKGGGLKGAELTDVIDYMKTL